MTNRPMHRLMEVRRREEVSQALVANRLGIDLPMVKLQECESSDILLSTLYQWQEVLNVPLTELLTPEDDALSPAIEKRANLVRIMKTVVSISEQSAEQSIRYMAQTMINQLIELMPELEGIQAWRLHGKKRKLTELGRVAELVCAAPEFEQEYCAPENLVVSEV